LRFVNNNTFDDLWKHGCDRLSFRHQWFVCFTKRPISSVKIGMLFESAKFPFVLKMWTRKFPCQLIDWIINFEYPTRSSRHSFDCVLKLNQFVSTRYPISLSSLSNLQMSLIIWHIMVMLSIRQLQLIHFRRHICWLCE
jgi:hypothetical protein